jgi:DNA-directed RNA polymerase sigma subunit (sigma70/sigma32)
MEIRAELRLRNAAVLRARKARKWSQARLAAEAKITQHNVSDVERMQFKQVATREAALKIAVVLTLPPEEVLPPDMEENIVAEAYMTKDVNVNAILDYAARFNSRMILPAPDDIEEISNISKVLAEIVNELPPRERDIITMRYGLGDSPEYTLQECGDKFGISRERVDQIAQGVLAKLRHPVRANKLKSCVRDVEVDSITTE